MKRYSFTGDEQMVSREVKRNRFGAVRFLISCLAALFLTLSASAENLKTESRMAHHHQIPLRDAEGNILTPPPAFDEQGKPQELKMPPYSPKQTCGRCHEYEAISHG